jgi:hypothetical protein
MKVQTYFHPDYLVSQGRAAKKSNKSTNLLLFGLSGKPRKGGLEAQGQSGKNHWQSQMILTEGRYA